VDASVVTTTDHDDLRPDRVGEVGVLVQAEWLLGDLEATDKLDGVARRPFPPRSSVAPKVTGVASPTLTT
jgi:hypothetical protein